MKKYITSLLSLILIAFVLASCTGEAAPTESPEVLMTSAVGSMVASFFGTQTAMYTPPSPTSTVTMTVVPSPTIIYPTATFLPTFTPTFIYYSPTPTLGTATATGTQPTPTINSSALAVGCNNLAFVRDVTIPAGTVIERGQAFRKTWKVQNTGTCDWLFNYTLVHVGGDTFDGETAKTGKTVPVWSWSEVSVEMGAPQKPGTYTSSWRLSNGQSLFGETLTVSIVVQDVAPTAVPPTATVAP